ncbi:hypothetical protein H1O16_gp269 [Burkholderia phage BcepSaruman]|uniref:Uncharacterized protein n=1 Tax=Burkholderia phage BcepSaruman TaxID=2530032 RepID=A0A4D5ZGP9_9CAUD|nr:hypothetical protein H1O16_gp269 [Burkholderia phage BcepSaruman]QBX06682.1 hypothetical protein BcepSaruman_269 [Burkholderia phage BcepSaruman]
MYSIPALYESFRQRIAAWLRAPNGSTLIGHESGTVGSALDTLYTGSMAQASIPLQADDTVPLYRDGVLYKAPVWELRGSDVATDSTLGTVVPRQELKIDTKGNLFIDPMFVSTAHQNTARTSLYKADFMAGRFWRYRDLAYPFETFNQTVDDRDDDGRLMVQRGTSNLITNPTFAGAVIGTSANGGSLPTGWTVSDPTLLWEVLQVGPKLQIRFTRTGASPAGVPLSFNSGSGTAPTLTRGGLTTAATVNVLNVGGVATGVVLKTGNARAASYTVLPAYGRRRVSIWNSAIAGDQMSVALVIATTNDTDPFSITVEISKPQIEDGANASDNTAFVATTRAASTTKLFIPNGGYTLAIQGRDGGVWSRQVVATPDGYTIPVPQYGSLAIESVVVLAPNVDSAYATRFAEAVWPINYTLTFGPTTVRTVSGRQMAVRGVLGGYTEARNRQSAQQFLVNPGDRDVSDPTTIDRADLVDTATLNTGTDIWFSFALRIDSGTIGTASQCSVFGLDRDASTKTLTMDVAQDTLSIRTQASTDVIPIIQYSDALLQRGVWVNYVMHVVLGSQGTLQVWRDSKPVVNYSGAMGSGAATLSYGIARATDSVPLSIEVANMEISYTSLAQRVSNPIPVI